MAHFRKPAAVIAARCEDAYSFGRYRSWVGVAEALLARGYDAEEVEIIMRSKWMRWAADDGGRPYGRATARDLISWIDEHPLAGRGMELRLD